MKIAGFEFAEGARFQKGAIQNATLVGQHMELLRQQQKGELTPEDVLSDARNHNSPLHSFFEWDDSAAAHQHRLNQARGLIRAVVAVYVREDQPAVRARAYVHIPEGETSHYRESGHAMSMAKTRKLVLQRAWRELQAWRERYRDLKEFSELFDVVDETIKHLPKSTRQ
ncbi:hypothetical protein FHT98_0617 [Bosea sp. AK1]|uniref:hypothetical protein n=1 Tax=Bosea sp. AK1 TaxID=2587160 RepID=UPI00114E1281|nr:hypothetical protein [Bosea sp. AK1]TQI72897.1 hypothetical protein FHT98_0617 [Bosea sp. AK1]